MSIEAMKLAIEAIKDLRGYRPDIDGAIEALRTAIQQAEAQQPATGEPVKAAPYNPTEEMRWAMKRIDPALSSDQCRALWSAAWSASPSTHPAPSAAVTPEPVVSRNPFASRCYTMSESHLSGHRLIVGFEKLGDAQDAHEWVARQGRGDFTHQAPSVPDDVARNAERYRWLREQHWHSSELCCVSKPKSNVRLGGFCPSGDLLDEAIDAAMLHNP